MTTIRIKFRPSTTDGAQGSIVFQIIHNRKARYISTGCHIYPDEWNATTSEISSMAHSMERQAELNKMKRQLVVGRKNLIWAIELLSRRQREFTADDIVAVYNNRRPEQNFFTYMEEIINRVEYAGKKRIAEIYTTTLRSFRRYREGQDVYLQDFNSELMKQYESWLRSEGKTPNTISFYMRNLRAIYNRAVEQELVKQRHPFKHVYTGVSKTLKRAVTADTIRKIRHLDLSQNRSMNFARDIFLFSFYTRGMSFVDIAYLKKSDLKGNILIYRRRKTGQQLYIKWERTMQEIVDRYSSQHSNYLLPIISTFKGKDERQQYLNMSHTINRNLKIIGQRLGLEIPLTMYVARHSWASIAKSKNIPLSVISAGMGHDSESTTRIYLSMLDTSAIDNANRVVIESVKSRAER